MDRSKTYISIQNLPESSPHYLPVDPFRLAADLVLGLDDDGDSLDEDCAAVVDEAGVEDDGICSAMADAVMRFSLCSIS